MSGASSSTAKPVPPPPITPWRDAENRPIYPPIEWLGWFQTVSRAVQSTASVIASGGSAANQAGNVSAVFGNGTIVSDGTYDLMPSAPYPLTLDSLNYQVGTAGGSFTAAILSNGASVAGLSGVTVSSAAQQSAAATGNRAVAQGGRVQIQVTNTQGAPTDAVLTLQFTRT